MVCLSKIDLKAHLKEIMSVNSTLQKKNGSIFQKQQWNEKQETTAAPMVLTIIMIHSIVI